MILKNKEIEVVAEDPFREDALGRKDSADVLSLFVRSCSESVVICLDGAWGQGKTTFFRMWRQQLLNEGVATLYFNAWENDFSDDALICLIGEISSAIEDISSHGEKEKAKKYLAIAKKLGVGLVKRSIPVAAKIATAGALDLDKITEQALASFAETLAKEQLENYEKSKKTLAAFKAALEELAASVYEDGKEKKPLVFIIDELDRCRPNFAIEVLEKAKHFFNVRNIVFVIGADKEQLGHSIRSLYGQELNVNGYLRRFIDFDYVLPPPEKGVYFRALFNRFGFDSYFASKTGTNSRYEGNQTVTTFSELFKIYNLSLREQEHCCSLLSLAIRTTPIDHRLYPIFLSYLIVLKVKEPSTYKSFIASDMTESELINHLSSKPGGEEFLTSNYGPVLEAHIAGCRSRRRRHESADAQYAAIANDENQSELKRERAAKIIKILEQFDWDGGLGVLDDLVGKIEIASRFDTSAR
jgi:hypothetical protein